MIKYHISIKTILIDKFTTYNIDNYFISILDSGFISQIYLEVLHPNRFS